MCVCVCVCVCVCGVKRGVKGGTRLTVLAVPKRAAVHSSRYLEGETRRAEGSVDMMSQGFSLCHDMLSISHLFSRGVCIGGGGYMWIDPKG